MSEETQDRWKPEVGEKYWTIVDDDVTELTWDGDQGDYLDREQFDAGLVFRTKEEAEAALAEMKKQAQGHIDAPAAADCSVCEQIPVTAASVLTAAAQHMQDRAATYDKPEGERSMASTVAAFNAITGAGLTEAQGWLFMAVLKQVRLFQREGYHADSAEDAAAYVALMAEAKAQEGRGNE